MPYKLKRLKDGKVQVTNTQTGKSRTYASREKAEVGVGMGHAIEHGFKPTGGKSTGRVAKAAKKRARKARKK